jgi:hypothetical protein
MRHRPPMQGRDSYRGLEASAVGGLQSQQRGSDVSVAMGFPLADYPIDPSHVEAFAVYVETGSPRAVCQLISEPLDGGPACPEVVWGALVLMARLGSHCTMADGSAPTFANLGDLVPPVTRGGAWSGFFLRVALADTVMRRDAAAESPIEVAARSTHANLRSYSAMPSLLMTLLWLTLLCSNASGRPPGELVRSVGATAYSRVRAGDLGA